MDMKSEDQVTSGRLLHLIHDLAVTHMVRDELALPVRKRMRA